MKNIKPTSDWFHLGASSILQPLSEEFLYRSSENVDRDCWRLCLRLKSSSPKKVDHA